MKALFFTIVVSGFGLAAAPASASDELPFTPAFAQAVGQYRDCVIATLDRAAPASPQRMTDAAMAACTASREAVRTQLIRDISTAKPHLPAQVAARTASDGMTAVNPMIAAAALDHARTVIGAASADAPALRPHDTIG